MPDELLIRCTRCGRVTTIEGDWETPGAATDDEGMMLGVCPGCQTREEQTEIVEADMEELGNSDDEGETSDG